MQIDAPTWHLRHTPCPCVCGGEGSLAFLTCPQCSAVVLVCDEVGTTFIDPRSLQVSTALSALSLSGAQCPSCQHVPLSSFEPASSSQIQALGFTPAEYR